MTRANPASGVESTLASSSTSFSGYLRSPSLSSLYLLTPTSRAKRLPLAGAAAPGPASARKHAAAKPAARAAARKRKWRGSFTGGLPQQGRPAGRRKGAAEALRLGRAANGCGSGSKTGGGAGRWARPRRRRAGYLAVTTQTTRMPLQLLRAPGTLLSRSEARQ